MAVFITGAGVIPPLWKRASDFAVGESVLLNENGANVEYLVVHQGLPSSMYDVSCNGTWLLRKDCYVTIDWASQDDNDYKYSNVHSYLNKNFYNLFVTSIQNKIKQVKIPYVNGTGTDGSVASGANGLSTKIFLLGGYEVGWTQSSEQEFPIDGACLSYFNGTSETDQRRIASLDDKTIDWWLRSPNTLGADAAWCVDSEGYYVTYQCSEYYAVRPAFIIDSSTKFNNDNTIKEVDT